MIVLDTNVISELTRPAPDARVVGWVDAQDDVAVTATTVAELLYGVARLPAGVSGEMYERAGRHRVSSPGNGILRDGGHISGTA